MMQAMLDVRVGNDSPVTLAEGQSMRAFAAEMGRTRWRPMAGDRVDQLSDAELMDSLDYTLFPIRRVRRRRRASPDLAA